MAKREERNEFDINFPAESTNRASHHEGIDRLNDAVFQAYYPTVKPRFQIVFIHGVREREYERAYFDTWLTRDSSECWPRDWLPVSFTKAAVYLVSYDSSATTDSRHGRFDMYTAGESLLADLIGAGIGQAKRCPVIFVGHDVGGLVIKKVCCQAHSTNTSKAKRLLSQVRGIFYYNTPHGGLQQLSDVKGIKSELFADLSAFNVQTSRLNKEFQEVHVNIKWKSCGLHAAHGYKLGQLNYSPEPSGRGYADDFSMVGEDSDEICKPVNKKSTSFQRLTSFIKDTLSSFFTGDSSPKLPFVADPAYVPLTNTKNKVQDGLLNKKLVVLFGDRGMGKTCLAKHLALVYQEQRRSDPDSQFCDGVYYLDCGNGADVVKIQEALLHQLGEELPLERSARLWSAEYDRTLILTELGSHFKDEYALVILDDVPNQNLLDNLVVPAPNVKYLVTTSATWAGFRKGHDTVVCRITGPEVKEGMQIIAKQVGFQDDLVPSNLERIVTEIMRMVGFHPLALSTLAMRVDADRSTRVAEWEDVKQNLDVYLDEDEERMRPRLFGTEYPDGVYAALRYSVKSLPEDEVRFLCIISLFEDSSIPLQVRMIELFVKWMQPEYRGKEYMEIKKMERRGFVQLLNVNQECNGDIHVSMHSLRKRFLQVSQDDNLTRVRTQLQALFCGENVVEPTSLDPNSNPHSGSNSSQNQIMAIALCAVYGLHETQQLAEIRLGRTMRELPLLTLQDSRESLLHLLPLMETKDEAISAAAEEVFWMYVSKSQLDRTNLLYLLSQNSVLSTSRMLVNNFLTSDPQKSSSFCICAFATAFEGIVLLANEHSLLGEHSRLGEALVILGELIGTARAYVSGVDKDVIPNVSHELSPEYLFGVEASTSSETRFKPSKVLQNIAISEPAFADIKKEPVGETSTSDRPRIVLLPNALNSLIEELHKMQTDSRLQALALLCFIAVTDYSTLNMVAGNQRAIEGLFLMFEDHSLILAQAHEKVRQGVDEYLALRNLKAIWDMVHPHGSLPSESIAENVISYHFLEEDFLLKMVPKLWIEGHESTRHLFTLLLKDVYGLELQGSDGLLSRLFLNSYLLQIWSAFELPKLLIAVIQYFGMRKVISLRLETSRLPDIMIALSSLIDDLVTEMRHRLVWVGIVDFRSRISEIARDTIEYGFIIAQALLPTVAMDKDAFPVTRSIMNLIHVLCLRSEAKHAEAILRVWATPPILNQVHYWLAGSWHAGLRSECIPQDLRLVETLAKLYCQSSNPEVSSCASTILLHSGPRHPRLALDDSVTETLAILACSGKSEVVRSRASTMLIDQLTDPDFSHGISEVGKAEGRLINFACYASGGKVSADACDLLGKLAPRKCLVEALVSELHLQIVPDLVHMWSRSGGPLIVLRDWIQIGDGELLCRGIQENHPNFVWQLEEGIKGVKGRRRKDILKLVELLNQVYTK